jgi:hypothetical protein
MTLLNLCLYVASNFYIGPYFFLKKVGRLDLETHFIDLIYYLVDLLVVYFDLPLDILIGKILFVIVRY